MAFGFTFPALSYKLKNYWLDAASRMAAASIEEAIIHTYRETQSIARTAQRMTFAPSTIRRKLHALHEPVRQQGGKNNPWGRKGKPGKTYAY